MDVLEYLRPSTISDSALRSSVALTVVPMQSADQHQRVVTFAGVDTQDQHHHASSSSAVRLGSVETSDYLTAPSAGSPLIGGAGAQSLSDMLFSLFELMPRCAAALQSAAARWLPHVWTVTPPVLVGGSVLWTGNSETNKLVVTHASSTMPAAPRLRKSSPRFVALHPHRRVMAVATPNEGSSRHGAILVYDLDASVEQPKQVLRNILVRELCGIAWKPGSRNILCVYGALGAALFHLSVDPRTGLDVEELEQQHQQPHQRGGARAQGQRQQRQQQQQQQQPLVFPSTGAAAAAAAGAGGGGGVGGIDLGVGCLYPAAAQLARFGLSPHIDRVSFFPGSGRFMACGSTESSGVRVVDVSFSPIEQQHCDWGASSFSAANQQQGDQQQQQHPAAGTFRGSPGGGTSDLAWVPAGPASTTALLLRAVQGTNVIDCFAAGLSLPVAQLATEVPVEQMCVSSWPNLTGAVATCIGTVRPGAAPPAAAGGGAAAAAGGGGGGDVNAADAPDGNAHLTFLRNNPAYVKQSGSIGPHPDRHVPVWLLYERAEGVVLTALSFNEAQVQNSPFYATPLMRLSTTVPPLATELPRHHPGGCVTRIAQVKEVGALNSGTVFMSVESGHIIAVKVSMLLSQGGASHQQNTSFAVQTTMVAPADGDDVMAGDDEQQQLPAVASEIVGVLFTQSTALMHKAKTDTYSIATWNANDGSARLLTVTASKCEKLAQ